MARTKFTDEERKRGYDEVYLARLDRNLNEMLKVTSMKFQKKIMKEGKLVTCYLKDNSLEIASLYFDGTAMSRHEPFLISSLIHRK